MTPGTLLAAAMRPARGAPRGHAAAPKRPVGMRPSWLPFPTRPVRRAELTPQQFPRRASRQPLLDIDRLRPLRRRELTAAELEQLEFSDALVRPQHDDGTDGLAPIVVGDANHGGLKHAGVPDEQFL